jgi:chemotaxis protein MotB
MSRAGKDDTGMAVYPKLPVPKGGDRDSTSTIPRRPAGGDRGAKKWPLAAAAVGALLLGFVIRWKVWPDPRVADLASQLSDAQGQTTTARSHADELQTELDRVQKAKVAAEDKLTEAEKASHELADKANEAERKAKEATAVEDKLRGTIDKSMGTVSSDGDEIHLKLVDHILFKTGDDQLTAQGKQVLDKVGVALRDLPDKQIWVQGHTDDQPIFVPPPPPPPPPKPGTKPPPKPATPMPPPPVKFVTNWELSSARALQVVHYLQDTAKVDPSRLAAVAFGQYHPISRTDRAQNRRIEIVLYPKRVVAK